jgi:hypothetical protein
VGGLLSHPAESWPGSIGRIDFLSSYPYFLPCFVVALVPLSACIFTALFMEEVSVSRIPR